MKKIYFFFLLIFFGTQLYSQTTIAKWTFEAVATTNTGTTPTFGITSNAADVGAQTAGSAFTGQHASSSTTWSNPAGNGSTKSVSSNNWAVNDYYQFSFSMTGYNSLSVTFDQTGSGTGPRDFKIQYSTDGTLFTDFANYSIPTNAGVAYSWASGSAITQTTLTFNLSAIITLNNASTVYIRLADVNTTAINGTTVATAGTGRVDNFTASATAGVLPITLQDFSANKNGNNTDLHWLVNCLSTSVTFELQRSSDAINFQTFYTSSETKARCSSPFDYTDANSLSGKNFYRLKIIDVDGKFSYSKIVLIVNGVSDKNLISVRPTVVSTQAEIYYSSPANEKVQWVITDMQGRVTKQFSSLVISGENRITIPTSDLSTGQYQVKGFTSLGSTAVVRFVKE